MPVSSPRLTATVAAALVLAGAAAPAARNYVMRDVRKVPVDRLVGNLERELKLDPADPQPHINLARLHGMAWALKADEVQAVTGPTGELVPWYGHEPNLIPYGREVEPGTPGTRQAARAHLEKALEHYRAALSLDPDNLLANLGYGWMLEQAGDKAGAVERYRLVVAKAWPTEKEGQRELRAGRRFFTREASEYLIPLLDPQADAAEIEKLREMQKHLDRLPRLVTPIAVPLSGGLAAGSIHDRAARVRFDADGSGLRREWTWITREAAWLVHDPGGRGDIPSALQLFGNVTFWLFWRNGYEALAALDDDGSGAIEGGELRGLGLWHDRDADGVSDAGEVQPVAQHGIVALSYDWVEVDDADFAAVAPRGVRFQSGEIRPTYDVILVSAGGQRTDYRGNDF